MCTVGKNPLVIYSVLVLIVGISSLIDHWVCRLLSNQNGRSLRLLHWSMPGVCFEEARLIDRATNYWNRIRREAIEIKLHPNNFNRDSGWHISKAWDPAISALRRLRVRGQHSTSAPALATPGVDQCNGCGERPFWLDSSRQTQWSIRELISTIRTSTEYITRFPTAHILLKRATVL